MRSRLSAALAPSTPQAFDLLRIGIALILLAKIVGEMPYFFALYDRNGLAPWALGSIYLHSSCWYPLHPSCWYPRMSWIADPAERFGIPSEITISVIAAGYIASLLLLLVGFAQRCSALVAYFCHMMMSGSTFLANYGVDKFATVGLFYCCVAPAGFLSLDRVLFARTIRSTYWATILLRLLQVQLFAVYAVAALAKASHISWWNGEAIWMGAMLPTINDRFDASQLAYHPTIAKVLGYSTLVVEGFYSCAMLSRLRIAWVFLIVLMHIVIGVAFDLAFFAGIMIVLNLCAFASREIFDLLRKAGFHVDDTSAEAK